METLKNKILDLLKPVFKPDRNHRILLAYSGGMDSSVLLDLLLDVRDELGLDLSCAYVNHNLRGDESLLEELYVHSHLSSRFVPFFKKTVPPDYWVTIHKESVEMAARRIRYDFFREIMKKEKIQYLITAHHLDDRIETLMINLIRSGGLETLSPLKLSYGRVIRPLYSTTRGEIDQYRQDRGLSYVEDRTNREDLYLRNRIRSRVLPAISELTPGYHQVFQRNLERFESDWRILALFLKKELKRVTLCADRTFAVIREELFDGLDSAVRHYLVKILLMKLKFPARPDRFLFKQILDPVNKRYQKEKLTVIRKKGRIWFVNQDKINRIHKRLSVDLNSLPAAIDQKKSVIIEKNADLDDLKASFIFSCNEDRITIGPLTSDDRFFYTKDKDKPLKLILRETGIPDDVSGSVRVIKAGDKTVGYYLNNRFFRVSPLFYTGDSAGRSKTVYRIRRLDFVNRE